MMCKTITSLAGMPTTGMLFGTSGGQGVISMINEQYMDTNGVIFAAERDPYRDTFMKFTSLFDTGQRYIGQQVAAGLGLFTSKVKIIPITTEEQLYKVPESMWMPILTYAPVRQLFENEQIYGFGVSPECLPDEDVYGRLIHNGECDYNRVEPPKNIVWEWKSSDPQLEIEELHHIEATRGFIDRWLAEQLGPDGDRIDPTDPTGRIGKIQE